MRKNILLVAFIGLTLLITTTALTRADETDKVRILIYKASEQTSKVILGSQSYLVPISIETGLSWDDVKDGYALPPAYANLLTQGRITLSVTCSGMSFTVVRAHKKK